MVVPPLVERPQPGQQGTGLQKLQIKIGVLLKLSPVVMQVFATCATNPDKPDPVCVESTDSRY
jgi:hypothetical protein